MLESVDRQEHFDPDGGGSIVRVFYVEPYTAHKRVLIALKGTVTSSNAQNPTDPNAVWSRVKPHADPLYPHFYCNDVQVVPFNKTAVRGSRSKAFVNDPGNDDPQTGQLPAIQNALNVVDDFDGASFIDNLTNAEIQQGYATYFPMVDTITTNTGETFPVSSFKSRGTCGCFIVATYNPLIFLPGIVSNSPGNGNTLDPFDYVDPQWEPITYKTQLGRSLYFHSPTGGIALGVASEFNHAGVSDTYEVPEVIWRLTIRRLMVPFIPKLSLGLLTNKINANSAFMGNLNFAPGTLRMETPEIVTKRGPDGNIWHDIKLSFLVRMLYDEYYDDQQAHDFVKGMVDWNHQAGVPNAPIDRLSYYPVAWNGGLFQLFGANHPLFLRDKDIDLTLLPNQNGITTYSLSVMPFQAGFIAGQ
jgi:hypothetical protein